jgi:hypothetical protein
LFKTLVLVSKGSGHGKNDLRKPAVKIPAVLNSLPAD